MFQPSRPLCPCCFRALDARHLVVYHLFLGRFQPMRIWCKRERRLTDYPPS